MAVRRAGRGDGDDGSLKVRFITCSRLILWPLVIIFGGRLQRWQSPESRNGASIAHPAVSTSLRAETEWTSTLSSIYCSMLLQSATPTPDLIALLSHHAAFYCLLWGISAHRQAIACRASVAGVRSIVRLFHGREAYMHNKGSRYDGESARSQNGSCICCDENRRSYLPLKSHRETKRPSDTVVYQF